MVMEITERKLMTREQYLVKRNNKEGVDATIIYSFYIAVCEEKGMRPHPIETFIQALGLHPNGGRMVQQALEYYDNKYGIIEMSIMRNNKREVINYI